MLALSRVVAATVAVAVLTLLLVAPQLSSATTTMLPFLGDVVLDVESVCRRVDAATGEAVGNTTVRTLRVAGNTASSSTPYPFYVRELRDSAPYLVQFLSSSLLYTTTYSFFCTQTNNGSDAHDYTAIWKILRQLIGRPGLGSTVSTSTTTRDIGINTWPSTTISGAIPVSFGGDGTSGDFRVSISTIAEDWSVNSAKVHNDPLFIQLNTTSSASPVLSCEFNVAYYGTDAPDSALTTVSAACQDNENNSNNGDDTNDTDVDDENPMPAFPPEFTADFQVIMPSQKKIWTMHESYSSYTGDAKTSVVSVHPDNIGRASKYEWYTDGSTRMVYFYQYKGVAEGKPTLSNAVLREYFWPNTESCRRAFVGYGSGTSTSSLLLYSSKVTPSFIGNQTVRNIPCGVWTALVDGARVTWFWAREDVAVIGVPDEESEPQQYGRLVRMTVEGTGPSAPLFVHHPFFQQGNAFPEQSRLEGCYYFGAYDLPGCVGLADNGFFFIYDIIGFSTYTLYDSFTLPAKCTNGTILTHTYPSIACDMRGGGAATALLVVVVALVCLLIGGCCVWMRFAPIIRGLQEDTVRLAEELRKGDVMQPASPDEPAATAAAPTEDTTTNRPSGAAV